MTEDTQGTLGGPQEPDGGSPAPAEGTMTKYVVQVERDADLQDDTHNAVDLTSVWVDVAAIQVPKHTHRQTALEKGLEQAGLEVTLDTRARLLDAEAAYVWTGAPPKTLRLV